MTSKPILEPRQLHDYIMAEVDDNANLILSLRGTDCIEQIIGIEPETQQALRRYIDDLQRAIEQRNVGPNASAQNAVYGANNAANKDQTQ